MINVTTELLWSSPEVLRYAKTVDKQKADVFSLGIIIKEVFTRSGPFTEYPLSANGMSNT